MNQLLMFTLLISAMSPLFAMSDPERKERAAMPGEVQEDPRYSSYFEESCGLGWAHLYNTTFNKQRLTAVALHPERDIAAIGTDHGECHSFYDIENARAQVSERFLTSAVGKRLITRTPGTITSIVFSPNGNMLAVGKKVGYKKSHLTFLQNFSWDIPRNWKETEKPYAFTTSLMCLQFSPASDKLAIGCHDGSLKLWDVARAKYTTIVKERIEPLYSLAYVDENTICYNDECNGLVLRDTRSPAVVHTMQLHRGIIRALSANITRKLIASGSIDGNLSLRDIRKPQQDAYTNRGNSPITSLAMHPYFEECVAGYRNGYAVLYDTRGNISKSQRHQGRVAGVAMSATKQYWAMSVGYDAHIGLGCHIPRVLSFAKKTSGLSEGDHKKSAEQAASDASEDACSICLDGYASHEDNGNLIEAALDCGHTFHIGCIKKELPLRNHACPLCRKKHTTNMFNIILKK